MNGWTLVCYKPMYNCQCRGTRFAHGQMTANIFIQLSSSLSLLPLHNNNYYIDNDDCDIIIFLMIVRN